MLRRLQIEQENVRAALEWALTSPARAEKGVELAGALFWFWTKRSQFEEGQPLARTGARGRRARAPSLRARALLRAWLTSYYFQRERGPELGRLKRCRLDVGLVMRGPCHSHCLFKV